MKYTSAQKVNNNNLLANTGADPGILKTGGAKPCSAPWFGGEENFGFQTA